MRPSAPVALGRRLVPRPLLSLVLLVVWLLLVGSLSWGQILLGAALGWAIPLYTRAYWPEPVRICRPLALVRLIGVVLYDIAVANLTVAWAILVRSRRLRPAFVEVPVDLRTDLAIGLFANTVSLTPGTVSAWLSPDRRTLVVHGLDLATPETLAAELKARYEAPLKEIFESC